ncbi:PREDICTED: G-protein coupled receptor 3-like [Acropora digitifera]|uniref:G-protein coupled receptor 3-like n=1 Tax=Acropora digitifera TaxID=70779 RepID=UPI00077A26F5|nr:PREDICTED: G-protein coupled receptor 3-like [Acropora digitifera]
MERHFRLVDQIIKEVLCFDYLLQASESFNQTASSVELPNKQCLLASLPEHAQHTLNDVTILVVLPLDTLLALVSVTFNTVILVAILRTRSIQRPSLLLLCSLSTTDIIWAIFSAIHNTKFFILKNFCPKDLSEEEVFTTVLCFFSTLGSLAVISRDRLLAVNNPWWYRSHANRSHAVKQITLVWIIALTFSGMAAGYQHNKSPLLWSLNVYLSNIFAICYALTIIGCYIGVLIANRRHGASMHLYGGPMRTVLRREKQIANTVGLILLVLCFTVLPAMIAPFVLVKFGFSLADMIALRPFKFICVTLNGLLNPVLNHGRNDDVRRAVRSLIRCQRCCGEGRHIGRDVDHGQRRRNMFPFRGSNRVTVESHQVTH